MRRCFLTYFAIIRSLSLIAQIAAAQTLLRVATPGEVAVDAFNVVREALVPVPTEKGVDLMAQWQAVALNTKPKRPVREYMDLRFVNEVMTELAQK